MYWVRVDLQFTDTTVDPQWTVNLIGTAGADPVVAEMVGAGIPEPLAYSPAVTATEGTTLTRCRVSFGLNTGTDFAGTWGIVPWYNNLTKYPVPSPYEEANSGDWMAWGQLMIPPPGAIVIPQAGIHQARYDFDVRSQRRIKEMAQTFWLTLHPGRQLSTGEVVRVTTSSLFKGARA